jgi:hypothetical protein
MRQLLYEIQEVVDKAVTSRLEAGGFTCLVKRLDVGSYTWYLASFAKGRKADRHVGTIELDYDEITVKVKKPGVRELQVKVFEKLTEALEFAIATD